MENDTILIQLLEFCQKIYDTILPWIIIRGIIEFMFSDFQKAKDRNASTAFLILYLVFCACWNFYTLQYLKWENAGNSKPLGKLIMFVKSHTISILKVIFSCFQIFQQFCTLMEPIGHEKKNYTISLIFYDYLSFVTLSHFLSKFK